METFMLHFDFFPFGLHFRDSTVINFVAERSPQYWIDFQHHGILFSSKITQNVSEKRK